MCEGLFVCVGRVRNRDNKNESLKDWHLFQRTSCVLSIQKPFMSLFASSLNRSTKEVCCAEDARGDITTANTLNVSVIGV